jgi:hypothetical protein
VRGGWVDEVRGRAQILEIAGQYTEIGASGSGLRGPCPLHGGKGPNFAVYPDRGSYKCYVCDAGGDVFTLVMEMEGLDFIGAAKHLAAHLGIDIPTYRPRARTEEERARERLQGEWAKAASAAGPAAEADGAPGAPAELPEADEDPWARLGLSGLSVSWGLGVERGADGRARLLLPVYEDSDVPLGWLRYQAEEMDGGAHPRFRGADPRGDGRAAEVLYHHPSLSSYLRKGPLLLVDDAPAVLALARLGYPASAALPSGRAASGEPWLTSADADHLAELGAKQVVFLIPTGASREERQSRMRGLFAAESLLVERGIQPLLLAPGGVGPGGLPELCPTPSSWAWVREQETAEALASVLRSNEAVADLFELRVAQVQSARERAGGLGWGEAVGKLRPTLDAALRSGDRVLYHAYMAWACRALGESDRWRLVRTMGRA